MLRVSEVCEDDAEMNDPENEVRKDCRIDPYGV
jgi:hypothetical protein